MEIGKPYPLPYALRNPDRNLKFENYQDYAEKPQRNSTFMNLASEEGVGGGVEELGIVGGDGGENKKSRNRDLKRRGGG